MGRLLQKTSKQTVRRLRMPPESPLGCHTNTTKRGESSYFSSTYLLHFSVALRPSFSSCLLRISEGYSPSQGMKVTIYYFCNILPTIILYNISPSLKLLDRRGHTTAIILQLERILKHSISLYSGVMKWVISRTKTRHQAQVSALSHAAFKGHFSFCHSGLVTAHHPWIAQLRQALHSEHKKQAQTTAWARRATDVLFIF